MGSEHDPHSAEALAELGSILGERVLHWLRECRTARESGGPAVLDRQDPVALSQLWPAEFPARPEGLPGARALALLESALSASNRLHHRRYVGHQVSAPLPLAALFEGIGALLNNGMAVYEMGQLQTICERQCVAWMARRLGWDSQAGGVLTSGGSLGNLTALLAARQAKLGSWSAGTSAEVLPAVLVSADSHYCIARAAGVLGWGEGGVIRVPVDEAHRMRTELLSELYQAARERGRRPIAVVASSCTTSTGAFDPLPEIAAFCAEHDLWLHVDGAHGASHALSERHSSVLDGIELADSVVWDAHKLMMMPALITAVLFQDGRHSHETFAQEARYLFHEDSASYDVAHRTLECTKRGMGLTLYAALHTYGTDVFRDYLDGVVDLAQAFADEVEAAPDLELAVRPATNIVCFRWIGAGPDGARLDALQEELRRRIVESGRFYLVQTRLPRGVFLRLTLMNSTTTLTDLRELLAEVRELAAQLLSDDPPAAG
jgi:L-2,4-diaminobutyrate decarboxylase